MLVYPVYILSFLLAGLCLKIYRDITLKNEYQLKYLLYHFVFQFLTVFCFSFSLGISIFVPAEILILIRINSFSFLLLHIRALIENRKVNPYKFEFLLLALILLTYSLNRFGIQLFEFKGEKIYSNVIGFNLEFFQRYADIFYACVVISVFYILKICWLFIGAIKKNPENLRKKIGRWFYSYVFLISIAGITTLIKIYITLINIEILYLNYIQSLVSLTAFFLLFLKPSLVNDVISIKKTENYISSYPFERIDFLFSNLMVFRDSKYSVALLAKDLNESEKTIRDSIKFNSKLSATSFINSARIKYACNLIVNNYLNKFKISALIDECGFSGQQNFNKAFKLFKGLTPSEYKKTKKLNTST
ncbi:helix-turn-helix domain-containing protein [Flavobacteriaceae bacterium]|nr:helix-turn-helix domain-containing protein [Flavobacteriaceae bacterium]